MAVFHLKASFGSRAGGQSAVAKSDYIEREERYEKDGEELEHKEHDKHHREAAPNLFELLSYCWLFGLDADSCGVLLVSRPGAAPKVETVGEIPSFQRLSTVNCNSKKPHRNQPRSPRIRSLPRPRHAMDKRPSSTTFDNISRPAKRNSTAPGSPNPAPLDTGHRAAQSRPVEQLISSFPGLSAARQRPFAPGWAGFSAYTGYPYK